MNSSIQSNLAVWAFASMALGFLVGKVFPDLALDIFIPFALFIMLFPAMMDIELHKIRQAVVNPKLLLISHFINFIIAPLLIFLILHLISSYISRDLMMGAILFAVMPCGGMVTAYTSMMNGNVNLAICIQASSLLLSIGLVPVLIEILAGESVRTPCTLIGQFLATCIVLPIIAACLLRRYFVARKGIHVYERLKRSLKTFSGYGLILLVFIVFVSNGGLLSTAPSVILKIFIVATLFFAAQIICSMLLAKAAKPSFANFTALVISTTANNTALALALATSYFGPEACLFISIAGPLVQLPCMLGFLKISPLIRLKTRI